MAVPLLTKDRFITPQRHKVVTPILASVRGIGTHGDFTGIQLLVKKQATSIYFAKSESSL